MKIIESENVNYVIWFLEGLPGADSLSLSLLHPFPLAQLLGVSTAACGQAVRGNGVGCIRDGS